MIPPFGAESVNETKYMITITIDTEEDHAELVRLGEEFKDQVLQNRAVLFPGHTASDDALGDHFNSLVTSRKKKSSGEDTWPGLTKASCFQKDLNTTSCTLVDHETNEAIDPALLPGMRWTSAIFELSFMYIQSSKVFGVTRKLRRLVCESSDNLEVILL